LDALLREKSSETLGAGRIKVLTFVVAGSSLDLITHRLAITPTYLLLPSKTARTGGISFLNRSKHFDNAPFSETVENFFEKISSTEIDLIMLFPPLRY
jgi:hypothetical protein